MLRCDDASPSILDELELEEEAEAIEWHLATVLIDWEERAEGLAAIAERLGISRQRLAYGLSRLYHELAFIRQDVGTRVHQEQQESGPLGLPL